ncbi:MAG: alpha/beta-type small acid-soluble spore protein [Turicibacter sp.]|nr:alpha/beta-type small acid-soluble spore protein [Turicibacter sp.]
MAKKYVNLNAKKALEEMKLEIANEIGIETNNQYGSDNTSYENGQLGGRVGGLMSKKLVEIGQQVLIQQYNINK